MRRAADSQVTKFLRLLYRLPWLMLHLVLMTPLTVLCHTRPGRAIRIGGRSLDAIMLRWWAAVICRIYGLEPRVSGTLPEGPLLIVANHISWLDIQLLHSVAPMGFVAKAEIDKWPLAGWLARVGGTVFHQRGSHDSASGVVLHMTARLQHGGRIAIFPEGGILPGSGIKRFHARLFGPAIETGSAVQPVMLRYLREGQLCEDVTFLPGESFLANFFRLLQQPRCIAELQILQPLESVGSLRRDLAAACETAVREAFERGIARA